MGYHRPVSTFNASKRFEHLERKYFVGISATPSPYALLHEFWATPVLALPCLASWRPLGTCVELKGLGVGILG